jgi:hypothetical protein
LRQPSAILATGLEEAGRCDPGRMDARRHTARLDLLCEGSGSLSDLV